MMGIPTGVLHFPEELEKKTVTQKLTDDEILRELVKSLTFCSCFRLNSSLYLGKLKTVVAFFCCWWSNQ